MASVSRRKLLLMTGAGIGGTAAAAAAGGVAFVAVGEARYASRFYPGVRVDGEDLGGLTYDAALARLQARWGPFLAGPVIFRLDDRIWSPVGREVGIAVDYVTPLRQAYDWGREGDWAGRFAQQRQTVEAARDWRTAVSFDPNPFMTYVEGIAAEVTRPASDGSAEVRVMGGRPLVVVDESRPGWRLRPADYLGVMSTRFDPPKRLVIDLEKELIRPAVTTEMLTPVADEAARLLEGHIELVSPEGRWAIAREDLAAELSISGPADRPALDLDLDYRSFEGLAEEIAERIRVDPVEPKITVDADGNVVPSVSGRPGRQVDVETLWSRVRSAMVSGESMVQVPIVILEPDITRLSASELQFDNVVAVGESFFWGSSRNRVRNIDVGSAKIDGAVVPPGESFSFNERLGPITYETGFVEGLIIAPTRTEPGVGGGICQVSTTLFRALFWSGLPIEERWQHVYRVGYYELGKGNPPGFDAAIWQPTQDLRFTNDTPNYLLIRREFEVATGTLRFKIMGAPIGRRVELESWRSGLIEPPPLKIVPNPDLAPGEIDQTDSAVAGMQAVIYRTVLLGSRVLFKGQFPSSFAAWPERWEIGPNPDGSVDFSLVPGYVPPEGETPEGETPEGEAPLDDAEAKPDDAG